MTENQYAVPQVRCVTPLFIDYPMGLYMGKFLRELKENGRLVATTCKKCGRIMFPPQAVCAYCHAENLEDPEWVEIGPKGTLAGFMALKIPTINIWTLELEGPKYIVGIIVVDAPGGGACSLFHLVGETDESKLKVGMRLEVVFKPKEERQGRMEDILYWKPVQE